MEKQTRVRRVVVESVEVSGAHGGFYIGTAGFAYDQLPVATLNKMLAYGTTQLVNDALAGEDDKEAALDAVIQRIKSGDWSVTRKGGTASGLTLESVALDMIKSAAKAKGKTFTAKELKTLAANLLADETRLPKVEAELARRKAEVDDIDLGDLI